MAALGYYTAGIVAHPTYYRGYYLRGQTHFELERWTDAAADFTEVITRSPASGRSYWSARLLRSAAFDHLGLVDEANKDRCVVIDEYGRMADQTPDIIERHLNTMTQGFIVSAVHCADLEQRNRLWDFAIAHVRRYSSGEAETCLGRLLAERGGQLSDEGRFQEAESFLREVVLLRERTMPDHWRRFNAMSLLGESLLGQGRFAEAEPFLVEGALGLKTREQQVDACCQNFVAMSIERVVAIYERWGRLEDAIAWREKLLSEPKMTE
jgi:tetratricopeptide (TPR) repeat protein